MPSKNGRPLRPGVKALKEIRHLQKTTALVLPKGPFIKRIKWQLLNEFQEPEMRMQTLAAMALHEAFEAHLVQHFSDAGRLAIHARRVTLMPKDMQLAKRIQSEAKLVE